MAAGAETLSRATPHQTALLATAEEVEAQFYEALREADIEKLMSVWADDEEVVCIPPGGVRMIGVVAVRAAFEAIFGGGALSVHAERVRCLHGLGCAVHSVMERLEFTTADGRRTAWILATNVYLKTAMGWRMVSHHASPAISELPAEVVEVPAVLH